MLNVLQAQRTSYNHLTWHRRSYYHHLQLAGKETNAESFSYLHKVTGLANPGAGIRMYDADSIQPGSSREYRVLIDKPANGSSPSSPAPIPVYFSLFPLFWQFRSPLLGSGLVGGGEASSLSAGNERQEQRR